MFRMFLLYSSRLAAPCAQRQPSSSSDQPCQLASLNVTTHHLMPICLGQPSALKVMMAMRALGLHTQGGSEAHSRQQQQVQKAELVACLFMKRGNAKPLLLQVSS